jgi:tetratricopeptide (TPR) repeat protein
MAASVKNPERITGAVGTTPHSCQSQFLGSTRNFTFQRPKPADHAVAPLPPAPTSRAPMKPEARKLFSEGVAFLGEQQPDRALRKFMSAEEIDPRNSSILMNIGVAHKMRREYPQARNYFQQAIRADKTDAEAHYNLACVLALENRTKEAMDALRNAIRYGFDDIKTLEVDSDIESLRALPGFEELKRQAAEPRRKGR